MTSAADHFEPLLNIAPSSRTHKIQAANGTLEAKLADANTLWNHPFPVPVRAGLYPFPEDHRFKHQACQGLAGLGLALDVNDADSSEFHLHVVFPGAGTISRRDNIIFSYELEADITTGDTLAFLNKIGNAGDQTNAVANIFNGRYTDGEGKKQPFDYSFRGASGKYATEQLAYEERVKDGHIGVGETAMSIVWASEFISITDNKRICPCELVCASPQLSYTKPVAGGDDIIISVEVDQYPFFRTAFDRAGLRYRGGYHTNTVESGTLGSVYSDPTPPSVGSIFAYGADVAHGGVPSVRDLGDVDMYVQVIRDLIDPKRGILRVTGLAFAQVIDLLAPPATRRRSSCGASPPPEGPGWTLTRSSGTGPNTSSSRPG